MSIFKDIKDQLRELIDPNTKVVNIRTYVNRNSKKKNLIVNNAIKTAIQLELAKALSLTKNKKISVKSYKVGNYIYIHSKVPSTTRVDVFYDVLFRISADKTDVTTEKEVKIFSNDPSFIYKYAYVFNKLDLLIPECAKLLPPECLTQVPKNTNPMEDATAHKVSMMAGIYLLDYVKIDKVDITKFTKDTSLNEVFSMLQTFNSVMTNYHDTKKHKVKKLKNI